MFLGGGDDDFVFGDNGNDLALMGDGDDAFQWDPGDDNDTLEGQDGSDTMLFFGANVAEEINVVANGGRVLFLRNIANVTMDLNDVENVNFRALGGADNIVVGDLSGTDMTHAGLDLRGSDGGGDGAADTVTVNGTQGADAFGAAGNAGGVNVLGLQAGVGILFQEQANDRLTLNALGGDDAVNAASLEADGIQLTMNGGLGSRRPRRQRRATTSSTAATATTRRCWELPTTSSSGTRATTTTPWRGRTASTRCCSTVRTWPRTSTCRPTESASGSSATSPTWSWT